ncbi:unnamed protein product [Calypogeia fissa]
MTLHRCASGRGGGGASTTSTLQLVLCAILLATSVPLSIQQQQQLDWVDLEALRQIHYDLQDLPGSYFFSSWDFSQDPCGSFEGVQCYNINGDSRVAVLNLGTSSGGSPGLTGSLSPYIGNLTALVQISLVPGSVGGSIPSTISSLSNLQFLGLSQNHFTGKIPTSFSSLYKLQSLILGGNYLSGDIPSQLGYLSSLTTLSIANNQFSGKIPDFTSAGALQHMDLSINQLVGKIPPLPSGLNFLSLANNDLDGDLGVIAGLANLNYLDLSSNQFYGEIPYQLFSFPLQYLLLDRNGLSGNLNIPTQSSIQVVDLSYNNFTGTVPAGLGGVKDLYLNDNRFSGMVPPIFASNLQNAVIENLHLQHNYLIGLSNLLAGMTLPSQVTLCFQYNCGLSPPQTLCPSDSEVQETRPLTECLDSRNWS